jgi:hypothetical protein
MIKAGRDIAKANAPELIRKRIEARGDAIFEGTENVKRGIDGLAEPFKNLSAQIGTQVTKGAANRGVDQIKADSEEAAKSIGTAMKGAAIKLANRVLQDSELLGDVFQAAVEGFKAGGFVGAAIGAIAALLAATQSFQAIVGSIDTALNSIVNALDPLLAPFADLIGAIFDVFGVLFDVVGALLSLFQEIDPFIVVVRALAKGISWLVSKFTDFVNFIFDKIADFVSLFSEKAAKRIREAKIRLDKGDEDVIQEDEAGKDAAVDSIDALSGFGDAVRDATESLMNVPTGIKVAAERFKATDPSLTAASPGALPGAVAGSGGSTIGSINIGTIISDDPNEFLDGLEREKEFRSFVDTGSTLGGFGFSSRKAGET